METEIEVNDANFEKEVLEKSKSIPVIVDFWGPWCGPCRMIAPLLEEIAQEYQGKLKFCKLNVDEAGKTVSQQGITTIPTLNIYKNSKVVEQIIGFTSNYKSNLKKKIENILKG